MPPFSSAATGAINIAYKWPESAIVTLNLGSRIFQTTSQTLSAAGASSLLSSPPAFIDHDPDFFAAILALLCIGCLPSTITVDSDISDFAAEAEFYGLDRRLLHSSLSSSSFSSHSLQCSILLTLFDRDVISILSSMPSGKILATHNSKITSFDFSLCHWNTLLTSLPAFDSLLSLPHCSLTDTGASNFPGLQVFNFSSRTLRKMLNWHPHPSTLGAIVQAIGIAADRWVLFSSYESGNI